MDAFIFLLLSVVVCLGCVGLKHEARKRQFLHWTERVYDSYKGTSPYADWPQTQGARVTKPR